MATIVFGASHGMYIAQCLGTFSRDWNDAIAGPAPIRSDAGETVGHLILAAPRVALFHQTAGVEGAAPAVRLSEAYAAQIPAIDLNGNVCYLALGGNEHNSLFLCRHEVPFDFFDEHGPRHLLAGRQIVPKSVITGMLQQGMQVLELQLRVAAEAFTRLRKVMVAPPPPIPSDAQIKGLSEGFDFSVHPVEDRWVRLKVYRIYVDLLRAIAMRIGVEFAGAPDECVDADGFLREPYWNHATHAQPAYYRSMLFPGSPG